MCSLTHQEQVQAQTQGGWLSPGGGGGTEGKPVDIIQMLTNAHTQYDKVRDNTLDVKNVTSEDIQIFLVLVYGFR